MNVGFVSLGCSKNLIDTECLIGEFKKHQFQIVNEEEKADILVINTCGFIESAKEEAINTILEMAEYKKQRCQYLIVMGCLVQRYYEELIKALPEVDLFIKIEDYNVLWDKIEDLVRRGIVEKKKDRTSKKITEIPQMPMLTQQEFLNRTITTGNNYAYIKIGEGCSNKCTYCAIPYIRGPFVSRKKEEIIEEAKMLAEKGIKELIIIAQDTTKYGIDLYKKPGLPNLLEEISKINGIEWIRFLYSYPEGISKELIETVKNNKKILPYFDIPIQHISNKLLKKMNRKTSKEEILNLIEEIRKNIPNATLRTSIIVGFPGETNEDFEELMDFIELAKFDNLGAFMYSKEEGTPAASFKNQIHGNTKKSRYNKLMQKQQEIVRKKLEEQIQKQDTVLVEDISFDSKFLIGRTKNQAPDIDGITYIINENNENCINNFVDVKITKVLDYDVQAQIIK